MLLFRVAGPHRGNAERVGDDGAGRTGACAACDGDVNDHADDDEDGNPLVGQAFVGLQGRHVDVKDLRGCLFLPEASSDRREGWGLAAPADDDPGWAGNWDEKNARRCASVVEALSWLDLSGYPTRTRT